MKFTDRQKNAVIFLLKNFLMWLLCLLSCGFMFVITASIIIWKPVFFLLPYWIYATMLRFMILLAFWFTVFGIWLLEE